MYDASKEQSIQKPLSKQVLWIASLNTNLYLYTFEIFDCITCEHCDIIMSVCKRFQLSFNT
jgi:hypothetical protein